MGVAVRTCKAALLHEPGEVQNKSGKPFQVFTPFWKTMRGMEVDRPYLVPPRCSLPKLKAIGWKAGSCCRAAPIGQRASTGHQARRRPIALCTIFSIR